MRIGIYQCASGGLTKSQRLEKLDDVIRRHQSGSDGPLELVICPELFVSGYNVGDRLPEQAEEVNGQTRGLISEMCQELQVGMVYGYPERDDDRLFNSAALVGANGELLANHRKQLNSPGSFEEDYFDNGDQLTLLEYGGVRMAILICYEIEFPEPARQLALQGAQLIVVPTALVSQWGVVADQVVPARAFENGVWLVYTNHAGLENGFEYLGGSKIVAPDGRIVASAGAEETLITADIDVSRVEAAQRRLPYLRDCQKFAQQSH